MYRSYVSYIVHDRFAGFKASWLLDVFLMHTQAPVSIVNINVNSVPTTCVELRSVINWSCELSAPSRYLVPGTLYAFRYVPGTYYLYVTLLYEKYDEISILLLI